MNVETYRRNFEKELYSVPEIKKSLIPFMKRNFLEEVLVLILDTWGEEVGSFRFTYINGVSEVDGENELSPFKPRFLSYLFSLGYERWMTFLVKELPLEQANIFQQHPIAEVVEEVKEEIWEVLLPEAEPEVIEWEIDEGADGKWLQNNTDDQRPKRVKVKKIPRRKKPTNAEKRERREKNQRRFHIDAMRGDIFRYHLERMWKGVWQPTPDWYVALSSRLLTRVTARDLEEYRKGLFNEYSEQEFETFLRVLWKGTKWLDIWSGNTYQNKDSHVFRLWEHNPWIRLTCYDPIYKGKDDFPKEAEFVWWYAQELPFEDEVFEIVTSLQVFDKISQENKGVEVALLEALRVLKPRGILKIAPLNTLDMLYALCWEQITYLTLEQYIDIEMIGDQVNIVKKRSFSKEVLDQIKKETSYWNTQWRLESTPLPPVLWN